MNINLMIIVAGLACSSSIIVFGIKLYLQHLEISKFINKINPQIKSATTIPELIELDEMVSKFALIENTFKLKSFLYRDAKLLLVSIKSKLELLDRI